MESNQNTNSTKPKEAPNKGVFLDLIFNLVIPSLLLTKGESWFHLSIKPSLAIAISFPLFYGLFELIKAKKVNWFSVIGLVSVILKGGVGLLELPKEWIAINEAVLPLFFGLITLFFSRGKNSALFKLLLNDKLFHLELIDKKLNERKMRGKLERIVKRYTAGLASTFFLSATLNFFLAKYIIRHETGTQAFNNELGLMTAWSLPVIVVPCTIMLVVLLWRLLSKLSKLTGLSTDEMLR